jgi:hypothetical protein
MRKLLPRFRRRVQPQSQMSRNSRRVLEPPLTGQIWCCSHWTLNLDTLDILKIFFHSQFVIIRTCYSRDQIQNDRPRHFGSSRLRIHWIHSYPYIWLPVMRSFFFQSSTFQTTCCTFWPLWRKFQRNCFNHEQGGNKLLRNVSNWLRTDKASCPRRFESLSTRLWETKNSEIYSIFLIRNVRKE